MAAIQVRNLSKRYQIGNEITRNRSFRELVTGSLVEPIRRLRRLRGERVEEESVWALKDVSFDIEAGDMVGIVGRNGAGKSTLLKLLSRITSPTSGEIIYRGRLAGLLEVGTGFHPELTGRENVFLNGAILGMKRSEVEAKLESIVEFAEVGEFLDTPVKRYSSGMVVRLAFSVAAHIEPDILIVDEVLAVGDVVFQQKCLEQMRRLSRDGATILFVSHNLTTVQALTSRCIHLEKGGLSMIGPTADVVEHYLRVNRSDIGVIIADNGMIKVTGVEGRLATTEGGRGQIVLEVSLQSSSPVSNLRMDFEVENDLGVRVVHHIASMEQSFSLDNENIDLRYQFSITDLAHGEYFGVIYIYENPAEPLVHLEKVSLFSIPNPLGKFGSMSKNFRPVLAPDIHWEVVRQ